MTENEGKVEKSLKKMHKVVQFFSRLVEGEDDPLVKSFQNYLHTIMEGDGIVALLAEEETKE